MCIVWRTSSTAFNVACQSETMLATDENTSSVAMSIFSGIFNLGIRYVAGIISILGIIFYISRR